MVYTVRFHPQVQQDFSEAYVWYEEKQKGLGERFLQSVRHKIEDISTHPQTFGSRNKKPFREAQVDFFPYLIVFKIRKSTKEIFVASVHHTKKHPGKKYRTE